jgi:hypothetical protein
MEIKVRPSVISSDDYWGRKGEGVVFVTDESHIETAWKVLCEQDDYWESYKELIKVAPLEVNHRSDLRHYMEWAGKTDVDIPAVRAKLAALGVDIMFFYGACDCDD